MRFWTIVFDSIRELANFFEVTLHHYSFTVKQETRFAKWHFTYSYTSSDDYRSHKLFMQISCVFWTNFKPISIRIQVFCILIIRYFLIFFIDIFRFLIKKMAIIIFTSKRVFFENNSNSTFSIAFN